MKNPFITQPAFVRTGVMMAMAFAFVVLGSCSDDDDNKTKYSKYMFALRVPGSADESADYLVFYDRLDSGSVSAVGNGKEMAGWCYYANLGENFFSFTYDLANVCTGYHVENGKLQQTGKFSFERADVIAKGDDNTLVIAGAPWGGGSVDATLQLVDANKVAITKTVVTPFYLYSAADIDTKWPTTLLVRDGKLYVSFFPFHPDADANWITDNSDTAYVSVYDYPSLDYVKTMKSTSTGPIGYYGASPALIMDEDENIYSISTSSYAAGFSQVTKHSGFLRINSGETEFDEEYFYDFEAETGLKLLCGTYIGDGKALVRVVAVPEEATSTFIWSAFNVKNPICKLMIVDLENQQATPVEMYTETGTLQPDLMHGGQYNTPFYKEDGYVYVSINNGSDTYLYKVDPSTAKATRGVRLEGTEIQAMFKP